MAVASAYVAAYRLQSEGLGWTFLSLGHPLLVCPLVLCGYALGLRLLGRLLQADARGDALKYRGIGVDAKVLKLRQTGTYLNEQPQVEFQLEYIDREGGVQQVSVRRFIPLIELANLPRERVTLLYDRKIAATFAWRVYEAAALDPAGVLRGVAGDGRVAVAGGALQTLGETLGHSVQADSASAPIAMPPARERPASLAPMTEPRLPPVPERNNRLFDADYLLAARQALEQMPALAGHRLTIFHSIHFYDDGRINLDLVDPQQPSRVDSYHSNAASGARATRSIRSASRPPSPCAAAARRWPTSISRRCRA